MAEEAVILLTAEKLSNLLIQKAVFLKDVEGQVKWLKDELKRMQCFLAEKQADDERVCNWISEIAEVAQDAEDAIEIFILKAENATWSGGDVYHHHLNQVREEIESIRKRLQDIVDKTRQRFPFLIQGDVWSVWMDLSERSEAVKYPSQLFPSPNDEDVVGLEEDVELLLEKAILDEREGLSIATIVGMGGIGKTTLAGKVYNHATVADRFDRRAWVCVSSEFRRKEVIKELILQLLELTEDKLKVVLENMEKLEEPSLQQMLYQQLHGRRYFIVLDDMWEQTHWESLRSAFPNKGEASRLLITSRNRDIIEHAQYVHEMKILDPDKSLQLFLKKAFYGYKCPEESEDAVRKILKMCVGLPLAIKELGEQFLTEELPRRLLEKVPKRISGVLELSYHNLPPNLKLCFLCLGFFKKGAIIRAEKLVQVCVAQGMIPHGGGKETMEEIARSYLDKLISRYMVQVNDMTKDYRVKNCRINDNLHRLSITKAKEDLSLETLRKEYNSRQFLKTRHRAIYCSRDTVVYSMDQDKHLRSLFFYGGGKYNDSPSYWKSFELLRILDFEDFGLKILPDTIGGLTGLRYLGLRNNYIKELPHSLGCLKNLEVLDIALNFTVEVPNVILKMDSLRHLYMSDIICKTPLKIDALKNLQTLTYISVDNWTYELSALQMMTSLRKLGIEELDGYLDVSKLFTSLAKLENLVCLNLRGFRFRSMPSLDELGILHHLTQLKIDGLLTTLPSANNFPPNISYLTLVNTSLDEDPMPVLEKLSKLSYLKLRNAYTGDKMVISHDGFPKLQVLCIRELWHLRKIEVGNGATSMLKRLEINSCPYLESIPKEVGLMTNLQELKMVTTPTIASKLRDSHIISNIPYVDIQ